MGRTLSFLEQHVAYRGDDCLRWPFARTEKGYGQVSIAHKIIRKAHRVMCELAHGPAPTEKHHAAHLCGKGHLGCVNPRHLAWKTERENKQDNARHGTLPRNRWGRAGKFTPEKIREIRQLAATTSQIKLSQQFGVSPSALRDIIKGKTYRSVA